MLAKVAHSGLEVQFTSKTNRRIAYKFQGFRSIIYSVCALLELSCGLLAPPLVFLWLDTVSDHLRCFLERRTMDRHRPGGCREDFDYPPMDAGGFSPSPHPPPWLEPPPPYEVAIKTTCSSTHLRRSYSDTHLASEPLFGRSREISFEV